MAHELVGLAHLATILGGTVEGLRDLVRWSAPHDGWPACNASEAGNTESGAGSRCPHDQKFSSLCAAKQVAVERVNEHVVALVSECRVVVYRHDLQIVALQVRDESIRARVCAGEEEQDASGHPGNTNLGGEGGRGPRCAQELCRQRVLGFAVWFRYIGWRQCRWLIWVAVDAGGDGEIETLLAWRAP